MQTETKTKTKKETETEFKIDTKIGSDGMRCGSITSAIGGRVTAKTGTT